MSMSTASGDVNGLEPLWRLLIVLGAFSVVPLLLGRAARITTRPPADLPDLRPTVSLTPARHSEPNHSTAYAGTYRSTARTADLRLRDDRGDPRRLGLGRYRLIFRFCRETNSYRATQVGGTKLSGSRGRVGGFTGAGGGGAGAGPMGGRGRSSVSRASARRRRSASTAAR
jgi:hypothetical protein